MEGVPFGLCQEAGEAGGSSPSAAVQRALQAGKPPTGEEEGFPVEPMTTSHGGAG